MVAAAPEVVSVPDAVKAPENVFLPVKVWVPARIASSLEVLGRVKVRVVPVLTAHFATITGYAAVFGCDTRWK